MSKEVTEFCNNLIDKIEDRYNLSKLEDEIKWEYVLELENQDSIEKIKKQIKIDFPEELTYLIKSHNGGNPNKSNCDINGFGTTDFKCLLSYNENDDENIYDVIEYFINKYNGEILPFASDSGSGYYCISDKGIIYIYDEKIYLVARTINELLLTLYN